MNSSSGAPLSSKQALWRNTQFLSLLGGNTSLFFGYAGTMLLRSMLAWQLTGDEMALAYINLTSAICIVVASVFTGALVDRFDRRKLMILAHSVIAIAEAGGLILYFTDLLRYEHLVIITFLMSISFSFTNPARTAMMIETVGRTWLAKAMAAMAGGTNLARMLSPAIAGLLAETFGMGAAYLFLVTLYIAALLTVIRLKPSYSGNTGKIQIFKDIKIGFTYVFENKPLRVCILFGLLPTLVVIPVQNLLVIFADDVWHQGGSGLGILLAMLGTGGLLGSTMVMLVKSSKLTRPIFISTMLLSLFLVLFSQSPNFILAAMLLLMVSSFSVFTQTLVQTATQMMTDNEIRGRVATFTMMCIGLSPAGTVPLAYATKHLGAPMATTIAGIFMGLITLLICLKSESFKNIDSAAQKKMLSS